jgi:flagellum-specific peptidoglycan hydrolase FlgJ
MTTLTSDSNSNIKLVISLSNNMYSDNQVLADLTSTQAILEAGLRNSPPSELAFKYNNLFGIKGIGTNGSVLLPTHEYYPRTGIEEVDQQFAVNASIEDSLAQHKHLLELDRYASVLLATTFQDAALQIRLDGYATDPNYTQELIDVWNQYVRNN